MTEALYQASKELIDMIQSCANQLLNFAEAWKKIVARGKEEGFKEKELQEMMRPYLKQKLDSKKIYYLFNRESHIERVRRRKFTTNDDKKELEQSYNDDEPEIVDMPELENVDNVPTSRMENPITKVKGTGALDDVDLVFDHDSLRNKLLAMADGKNKFFLENHTPYSILYELRKTKTKTVKLVYFELE